MEGRAQLRRLRERRRLPEGKTKDDGDDDHKEKRESCSKGVDKFIVFGLTSRCCGGP
jgi:hypothetical protein